jgi:hypothetical protein
MRVQIAAPKAARGGEGRQGQLHEVFLGKKRLAAPDIGHIAGHDGDEGHVRSDGAGDVADRQDDGGGLAWIRFDS